MACSCHAKSNVSYRVPTEPTATKFLTIAPVKATQLQVKLSPVEKQSSDSSFGSTTKPLQECFNCVKKHLLLAQKLFQDSQELNWLIGAGQMFCAQDHLGKTHPQLAADIFNAAIQILRGSLQPGPFLQDLVVKLQRGDIQGHSQELLQISLLQHRLLVLLKAYSLMFVEITYQQVNRSWAVQGLVHVAFMYGRQGREGFPVYKQLREIWKMLQSMEPFDDLYKEAREAMQSFILSTWRELLKGREKKGA